MRALDPGRRPRLLPHRMSLFAALLFAVTAACSSDAALLDAEEQALRDTALAQARDSFPVALQTCLPAVAATQEGRSALLHVREGRSVLATQALLPLLARSADPQILLVHAWLAVQAGDPEAALRDLQGLAAVDGLAELESARALVQATALVAAGRDAEAVPFFRSAVAAAPEASVLRAAARAAWRGGEPSWSADCLLALRGATVLDAAEGLLLARALTAARRFAEARAAWDVVLARPDVELRLWEEAGLAAFAEGEATGSQEAWARAVRRFRTVLERDPQNARAQFNLGCTLDWSGATEEAIAAYERALEIRPDHVAAARNLVRALRRGGRPEAAAAVLRELRRQPLAPADAAWVEATLAALEAGDGPAG